MSVVEDNEQKEAAINPGVNDVMKEPDPAEKQDKHMETKEALKTSPRERRTVGPLSLFREDFSQFKEEVLKVFRDSSQTEDRPVSSTLDLVKEDLSQFRDDVTSVFMSRDKDRKSAGPKSSQTTQKTNSLLSSFREDLSNVFRFSLSKDRDAAKDDQRKAARTEEPLKSLFTRQTETPQRAEDTEGGTETPQRAEETEGGTETPQRAEDTEGGTETPQRAEDTEGGTETPQRAEDTEGGTETPQRAEDTEGGTETPQRAEDTEGGTETPQRAEDTEGGTETPQRAEDTEGGTETPQRAEDTEGGTETPQRVEDAEGGTETPQRAEDTEGGTETPQRVEDAEGGTETPQRVEDTEGGTETTQRAEDTEGGTETPQRAEDTEGGTETPQRAEDTKGGTETPQRAEDTEGGTETPQRAEDTEGGTERTEDQTDVDGFSRSLSENVENMNERPDEPEDSGEDVSVSGETPGSEEALPSQSAEQRCEMDERSGDFLVASEEDETTNRKEEEESAESLLSLSSVISLFNLRDTRTDEVDVWSVKNFACYLTFDPNTANSELSLTDGNRKATRVWSDHRAPTHPDRFARCPQVLCREGLLDSVYWEVEWSGGADIGVAYNNMCRDGDAASCLLGHNGRSWSLECSEGSYTPCHDHKRFKSSSPQPFTRRVGVHLDWAAGALSFYCVSKDAMVHLHTFTSSFCEPLYPAFWVWTYDGSVALSQVELDWERLLQ